MDTNNTGFIMKRAIFIPLFLFLFFIKPIMVIANEIKKPIIPAIIKDCVRIGDFRNSNACTKKIG